MRQTIRLTESDLRRIVRHTITEALDEMDKDTALYPMTMYAASNNMIANGQYAMPNKNGKDIKTNRVRIKARKISDRAIMHYVIQEMDPWLSFDIKDKTHPTAHNGIEFHIEEIKEFSDNAMQLYGLIVTSDWKGYVKKHGIVKCVFGTGGKNDVVSNFKFYLVQNIGNTVKTPQIELLGDTENETTIRTIINRIYTLRKEAEDNAANIKDLSSYNLNGNMNIKQK